MKKSARKNILAISILFASIFLAGCDNSINSQSNPGKSNSKRDDINFIPATREEMILYRQIGISYLCIARQEEVEFSKSIKIAASNFTLLVSRKHGGLIEEMGDKKLTDDLIYKGTYLQLIEGAIQICPDKVPDDEKNKFSKALEQINPKTEI